MLSAAKFSKIVKQKGLNVKTLAEHLVRGAMDQKAAMTAVRNWLNGLFIPVPGKEDVERLAGVLGVEVSAISEWRSSYRYAPMSPRKARLVVDLIAGRDVQDALDILKFTPKRAAQAVQKTLKTAIADADEQEAEVENLYVSVARVDGAGRRIATKGWRAKDRGRAHPIRKEACHIHVVVTES